MNQTYDLEPELQGRTPRQVRLARPHFMYPFWLVRIFLVPFLYIGVKTIWQATQSGIGILAYSNPVYAQTWGFPLAWSVVISPIAAIVWLAPSLLRQLIVDGAVTLGTVTGKNEGDDDGTRYFSLKYTFTPEGSTKQIASEMRVKRQEWEATKTFDRLTVVYLPSNPRRNTLYLFSPYQAVE